MNPHTLTVLEFEKVRRMILRWTFSPMGAKRVQALAPDLDPNAILLSQSRIDAWRSLELRAEAPGTAEIHDLEPMLVRLERGSEPLGADELFRFLPLLDHLHNLRRLLRTLEERTVVPGPLVALLREVLEPGPLRARLGRSISESGEILDSASPDLARARRELFESQHRASEMLGGMLDRLGTDREESFVTLREGRYVLSVRARERARLPGILHGRSQTGQSVLLEPLEALEANNTVADRREEVRYEEVRVLVELSDTLRLASESLRRSLEVVGVLDFVRAAAQVALELRAEAPDTNREGRLRIVGGRHPLLAEAEARGGNPVVPLDLELLSEEPVLVISGPNMGGKTVALKTIGLLTLMARAGLFVPASPGTDLPLVDDLFVDLGDEQSIEEDLSTFAGHLRNIGEVWARATRGSLVLLDELGGGTDPEEGGALAIALLEELSARHCLTVSTTHLTSVKLFAEGRSGLRNAAMEFDSASLRPRYSIRIGEAGRSRAFDIARRILPDSALLEAAERHRSPLLAELDSLHARLDAERERVSSEREALHEEVERTQAAGARLERQRERLQARIESLRNERSAVRGRLYEEAEADVRRIREELEARLKTRAPEAALGDARAAERTLARKKIEEERPRRGPARGRPLAADRLRAGEPAWLPSLSARVRLVRLSQDGRRVWVEWQGRTVEVESRLLEELPEGSAVSAPTKAGYRLPELPPLDTASFELDLRGQSAAEAIDQLQRFIDRAALQHVARIRIVHGKGTGTLKREVEKHLRAHPLVSDFRTGHPSEGGWGVTVVDLTPMGG